MDFLAGEEVAVAGGGEAGGCRAPVRLAVWIVVGTLPGAAVAAVGEHGDVVALVVGDVVVRSEYAVEVAAGRAIIRGSNPRRKYHSSTIHNS